MLKLYRSLFSLVGLLIASLISYLILTNWEVINRWIKALGNPTKAITDLFDYVIGISDNDPIISDDIGKDMTLSEKLKNITANFEFSNLWWPILWAQAYHETGGFTSAVFTENKNLFGMKQATVRKTTNKGTRRGHAVYNSLNDSIIDMMFYLKQWNNTPKNPDLEQYVAWLKSKGYFEDDFDNYLAGMKNGLNKLYIDSDKFTVEEDKTNNFWEKWNN